MLNFDFRFTDWEEVLLGQANKFLPFYLYKLDIK